MMILKTYADVEPDVLRKMIAKLNTRSRMSNSNFKNFLSLKEMIVANNRIQLWISVNKLA